MQSIGLSEDGNNSNNNTIIIIIAAGTVTVLLIICCIVGYIFYKKRSRRNALKEIEDNLSYKTFDESNNIHTQSIAPCLHNPTDDEPPLDIAANTLNDDDDDDENRMYKKSFRAINQLKLKEWELRQDSSGMPILYNRVEHKNYWPWKYPEVAKSLGLKVWSLL